MMLSAVFLFNVNEVPNLNAGMEAIASRWAVLEFNQTYKHGADGTKGEIEADSRFRYDPAFLKEKVCPALLNKMLSALATLAVDGIDYSCTEKALHSIQQSTNHLWAFASDVGLDYLPGGRVYINDLWERLREWYIDNGTLEIVRTEGKEKKIWHDQPRRGDKNVKAPNQVYQRFAELFPKIKRLKVTEDQERRGQIYLEGISLSGTRQLRGSYEPIHEAVTLTEQGYAPNEVGKATLTEISQTLERLDPQSLQALWLMLSNQTKQALSGSNNPQIDSFDSYPCPDRDTASLTGSLLPRESNQPTGDREPDRETKQIDWVRFQGQVWIVVSQNHDILQLRQSGSQKVIHAVHISSVEIGGYKQ
jgi:phage/plasmid-associated DNA primase